MRIRRKKRQPNSQNTIQPSKRSELPIQNQTERAIDLPTLQQQTEQPVKNFGDISIFSAEQSANPIPLQAKLTIGQPNDKYEQEADRVAADVVQTINSPEANQPVQKTEAEEEVQAKPLDLQADGMTAAASAAPAQVEQGINQAKGGGKSLAPKLQQKMGSAMGADFSGVRVHTDNNADRLNESIQAKAFTTGRDVFFKQGAYQPNSRGGQELIAHELTHVVQQNTDVKSSNARSVQRKVEDENKNSMTKEQVINYLKENKNLLEYSHDTYSAEALADRYCREDTETIGLEKLVQLINQKDEAQISESNLLQKAREIAKNDSKWWLDRLTHYNKLTYGKDRGLVSYFKEFLVEHGVIKNEENNKDTIITEFTKVKVEGFGNDIPASPADYICDLIARLLMEESIGVSAYQEVQDIFEERIATIKNFRGQQQNAPDHQIGDVSKFGRYYKEGSSNFLEETINWATKEGQGVMQIKFGKSKHTFVLEKIASNRILMYQAYEGNLKLSDFMENHDTLGQGKMMSASYLSNNLLQPLHESLSTKGNDKVKVAKNIYNKIFSCNVGSPVEIDELAVMGFTVSSDSQQESEMRTSTTGFLEL
ncbi:DUF4157 domain-containing protein [Pleurocapsales cyanobacterium LEGE 10410]|nr:DUF4157 domain-containing protein [Pleurocapsales cyanobacterium LEGE 10410]